MSGLLLLSEPEGHEGDTGSFDDLESDTRNITLGVTGSTETSDEDIVVLVDETHTTISWHVGSDFLVVLFELDSDTLSGSRVGLLGLNTKLLDDDSGGVR